MGTDNSEFEKKLLETFRVEAEGHLGAIGAALIELEKPISEKRRAAVVESTFREMHTLKGAARSVNRLDIEEICQALENVFSAARRQKTVFSREAYDLLHGSITVLEALTRSGPGADAAARDSDDLIHELNALAVSETPPPRSSHKKAGPALAPEGPRTVPEPALPCPAGTDNRPDSIRISAARLDSLMLMAEELGDAKRSAAQRSADLDTLCREFAPWKQRFSSIRTLLPAVKKGDRPPGPGYRRTGLSKIIEFLEYNAEFVHALESELVRERARIRSDHQFLVERTDSLIDDMKELLMMPAGRSLEFLSRFVREFSRDRGREAELSIEGQEVMIDRRILDEMKDAFLHMVRNAIDHGIEPPAARERSGKPRAGTISIRFAYHEGKSVEILVGDDGAGIDPGMVGTSAVQEGLITDEERDRMSDREIIPLIFQSGVTTSNIITDASGRGLGLAIVQEKVDRLGGSIAVETGSGKGTTFRIRLPLVLATFKGLIVSESRQHFVVPLKSVERVIRVRPETIKTVEGQSVIELGSEPLGIVRLSDALGIPWQAPVANRTMASIVVIAFADKRLGVSVDEIGYAQDVMVKGLGPELVRVRNIASATVLGTGSVVPVLNVGDLVKSAIRFRSEGPAPVPGSVEGAAAGPSILVAEDSITSRMLLRNILEGAGYRVETAVDGMEALTKLRSGSFDLVVSDVDMPRMNGFVLTEKIRADRKYGDLPVILVTALDSPADRERGIDVGANAYIVKSRFDQSNLLEVIERLVGSPAG